MGYEKIIEFFKKNPNLAYEKAREALVSEGYPEESVKEAWKQHHFSFFKNVFLPSLPFGIAGFLINLLPFRYIYLLSPYSILHFFLPGYCIYPEPYIIWYSCRIVLSVTEYAFGNGVGMLFCASLIFSPGFKRSRWSLLLCILVMWVLLDVVYLLFAYLMGTDPLGDIMAKGIIFR